MIDFITKAMRLATAVVVLAGCLAPTVVVLGVIVKSYKTFFMMGWNLL